MLPAFAVEHGLHAESTPAEIHEVPFINMDDGDAPWMARADWLAAGGVELQRQPGRVLFQNYPMVVQQALIGRGVALGWRGLIDELVDGGALTVVGPEVTSAARTTSSGRRIVDRSRPTPWSPGFAPRLRADRPRWSARYPHHRCTRAISRTGKPTNSTLSPSNRNRSGGAAAEAELDELNDAFDTVDAALKALDSDDLDQAEALVASLGDLSAVTTDDAEPESSSEA